MNVSWEVIASGDLEIDEDDIDVMALDCETEQDIRDWITETIEQDLVYHYRLRGVGDVVAKVMAAKPQ